MVTPDIGRRGYHLLDEIYFAALGDTESDRPRNRQREAPILQALPYLAEYFCERLRHTGIVAFVFRITHTARLVEYNSLDGGRSDIEAHSVICHINIYDCLSIPIYLAATTAFHACIWTFENLDTSGALVLAALPALVCQPVKIGKITLRYSQFIKKITIIPIYTRPQAQRITFHGLRVHRMPYRHSACLSVRERHALQS